MFRDFDELWPERFNNKTNGITPRRWLLHVQPGPADLITARDRRRLGDATSTSCGGSSRWPTTRRSAAAGGRSSGPTRSAWPRCIAAAQPGSRSTRTRSSTCQVKRIHEYKRQLLNVLHVHRRSTTGSRPARAEDVVPRTVHLRGQGGARLRHGQADHPADQRAWPRVVNDDPAVGGRLQGRLPAQLRRVAWPRSIIPAADLSEQISTAGHRGLGHRQHEVRPQRGADHRHPGRRQRRDPRGGGRGEHLHLRPDRRGGAGPEARGYDPRELLPGATPSCARRWT